MVELHKITKTYKRGNIEALNQVSFSVKTGELFGLIGPDGAGKTSLFRILTTLILPDSGSAIVNGFDTLKDFIEIRKQIGYMPGRFSLYQDLSVAENLTFFATLFNTTVEANYHLIRDIYTQIEPFKMRKAGKLSGGMKQKLALCCALIHRPTILFLDEPTTGVDVVSRKEFWEMLKRLKQQGLTILVSTPYMDEASLCERIALIQNGNIMAIDTPQNIIQQFSEDLYAIKSENMSNLLRDLRKMPEIKSCHTFGEYHHITLFPKKTIGQIIEILKHKNYKNLETKTISPTIEDCFIKLMSQYEA